MFWHNLIQKNINFDSFDENGNPIEYIDKFLDQISENKYLSLSRAKSHEAYKLMERFTETVEEPSGKTLANSRYTAPLPSI